MVIKTSYMQVIRKDYTNGYKNKLHASHLLRGSRFIELIHIDCWVKDSWSNSFSI